MKKIYKIFMIQILSIAAIYANGAIDNSIYVHGQVWIDSNYNNMLDDNEEKVSSVNVKLYKADGTFVSEAQTDSKGVYKIIAGYMGEYYVQFDSRYEYVEKEVGAENVDSDVDPVTFNTDHFRLDSASCFLCNNAGVKPLAHIGDYVWIDTNENGVKDANESGIPGAAVELLDENCTRVEDVHGNSRVVTDSSGKYGFDVPESRTYRVRFIMPEGYEDTSLASPEVCENMPTGNQWQVIEVDSETHDGSAAVIAGPDCTCDDMVQDSSSAFSSLFMLMSILLTLLLASFFLNQSNLRYNN